MTSTVINGTAGRDTLDAGVGNYTLVGGAGDDDINVWPGETTLVFDAGFGSDLVKFSYVSRELTPSSSFYQLQFGPGLKADDLRVSYEDFAGGQDSNRLVFTFASTGDRLALVVPSIVDWADLPIRLQFDDGTVISEQALRDNYFMRTQTNTYLHGYPGVSVLEVLNRGPHRVMGGDGDETLIAGTGADSLSGGGGVNTYVFKADWGTDNVWSLVPRQGFLESDLSLYMAMTTTGTGYDVVNARPNGQDAIRFEPGTRLADLSFESAQDGDLLIKRANGPGGILVRGYFDGLGTDGTTPPIKEITFSDGTRLSREQVTALVTASHPDGIAWHGGASNEVLAGTQGNDTLTGGNGNDRYVGGAGNDVFVDYGIQRAMSSEYSLDYTLIRIAGGDDTYVFNRGFGQDTIYDYGGSDTIEFGPDINPEDIAITTRPYAGRARTYGQLSETVIMLKGTQDRLVLGIDTRHVSQLDRYDSVVTGPIESLRFANGVVWGKDEIAAQIAQFGPAPADTGTANAPGNWWPDLAGNARKAAGPAEGTPYQDHIYLSEGTTQAHGGKGDDHFTGTAAGVVYHYDKGDGSDSIGTPDAILSFGPGIQRENVQLTYFDNLAQTVILSVDPASRDRLMVVSLQAIQFADGSTLKGMEGVAALMAQSSKPILRWTGTQADEVLTGRGGNDSLTGLGGNDTLVGADGNDRLLGDDGDDSLDGGLGDDSLEGGAGRDTLLGGEGQNTLLSGDGDDKLFGGGGRDYLVGGADNDELSGGEGQDTLWGETGQDTLRGGAGDDELLAGLFANSWTLTDADLLLGEEGKDTLTSDGGDDSLYGGTGDDHLELNGYEGHVLLNGGEGADSYVLREGRYTAVVQADDQDTSLSWSAKLADVSIWLEGEGSDAKVVLHEQATYTSATIVLDKPGAGSQLSLQLNDATLSASELLKRALNPVYTGTAGADVWTGHDGNDRIDGAGGNDTLSGGKGQDTLLGGLGDDELSGGAGADTYVFARGDGRDLIHADGLDTIQLGAGIQRADLKVGKLGATGAGTVVLSLGASDAITLDQAGSWNGLSLAFADGSRVTGADIMALATKPEPLSLTGTGGKDTLNGKDGDDTLTGLAGNDTLAGGKGNDVLNGGKGADTYLFNRGDGRDTIIDNDTGLLNAVFNPDLLKIGDAKSSQLWLTRSGNNLDISIIGTQDRVTVQDWFKGSDNQVEKITALGDGKSLSASKVNALVNAMATFTPSAMAGTSLPATTPGNITKLIASSWS